MRLDLLAAYLVVSAYDRVADMGNAPRHVAANYSASLDGLSIAGLRADIDAGRYAVGFIAQSAGTAPPDSPQMIMELAEAALLLATRAAQLNPELSLQQLGGLMPSIFRVALYRTRIRARYKATLEGEPAASTHNQVAFLL